MEYFIGDIQLFPYSFSPKYFLECKGQILQVAQYQALFTLLGATYGGDGRMTFALPNLIGTEPMPYMKYYICMQGLYPSRQ